MICSKCGKQLLLNEVVCSNCAQSNDMSNINNNVVNNDMSNINAINNVNDTSVNVGNVQSNVNIDNNVNQAMNNVNVLNNVNDASVNVGNVQFDNNIDNNVNQTMNNVNVLNNANDASVNVGNVQSDVNIDNNINQTMSNINVLNNVNDTSVNVDNVQLNKKSKKGLIITLSILGVLVILGITLLIINPFEKKENGDTRRLIDNTYTMYVKINPLVKLNVKEKYYECKNEESGKFEKCSDVSEEVISYNLINNDAKEIYKDIDLKLKNVVDALVILYDTARKNEIEFTDIEITTNWDNRYSRVELIDAIKKQSKYSNEFNIILDVEKGSIAIGTILDKYGIQEEVEITYTVVFNSDGGTVVPEQEVKENEKVVKPSDPTRDGYNFVEWQLNETAYNFDTEVKSDIELKAKWEQVTVNEEPPKVEETPKEEKPKEEPPKVEEPPVEEPKQESTLDKINLNDNIMVDLYLYSGDITDSIASYIFSTNARNIFANDMCSDNTICYFEVVDFYDKYQQLEFDAVKEQEALLKLESLNSQLPSGVKRLIYGISNDHKISFEYDKLYISYEMIEKFPSLDKQLRASVDDFYFTVSENVFNNALLVIPGFGMGTGETPTTVILTEEICNEYHLTCDRW